MNSAPSNQAALLFLGAGASRRMGRAKALLPWKGSTVIHHHFQTVETASAIIPWIVMQPNDSALTDELNRMGWPLAHRVINPLAPDCEMLESIRCGLRGMLESEIAYPTLGIALIDQALTRPSTFKALSKQMAIDPTLILQPSFNGRRGHPVFMPRAQAEALVDFSGPTFRDFLEEQNNQRKSLAVDDAGVVTDMDTPQDYQKQLQHN